MLIGTILLSTMLSLLINFNIINNISYGGVLGDYFKQILLVYVEKQLLILSIIGIFIINLIFCLGLTFREWRLIYKYLILTIKIIFKCINFIITKLSSQRTKFKVEDQGADNFSNERK